MQTVYPLSENTGLALTTYHYYTPSGRLIQRNYNGVSLYDYYYNHDEPPKDRQEPRSQADRLRTHRLWRRRHHPGRQDRAAAGQPLPGCSAAHNVFFNFAPDYLAHRTVSRDFEVDKSVLDQFKQFLTSQNIAFTDQDLDGVMDWLKMSIKSSIMASQFNQRVGLRVRANWDPMIAQALAYMPQAATLEEAAEKIEKEKQTTAHNSAPADKQ